MNVLLDYRKCKPGTVESLELNHGERQSPHAAAALGQIVLEWQTQSHMCIHCSVCVPVTLDVVDWEKMGAFDVLSSIILIMNLVSVAWKLIHWGFLPSCCQIGSLPPCSAL